MASVMNSDASHRTGGDGSSNPREGQLTIGLVGLGYVGLPTAISFLHQGHSVVGYDVSTRRIDDIKSGNVDLLQVDHERLRNATELELTDDPSMLQKCDTVIVAVPTPVDRNLVPDLSMLRSACETVVQHVVAGQSIILTSTSYVGTTRDLLIDPLRERGLEIGKDVHVSFSPERIDPGSTSFHQDEVPRVVGGATPSCTERANVAVSIIAPVIHEVSSPETAELTKLMENTFRAVNISLANEFADIARSFDIDPIDVIHAAATKPFGFMPFFPGPGVGGHCIPCDPRYLQWQLKSSRVPTVVIDAAMHHMTQRPATIVSRLLEELNEQGVASRYARVVVLGIAYKPNVQDVRESSAIEILELLRERSINVEYYDEFVPEVRLSDGTVLRSVENFQPAEYDAVLAHTLHSNVETSVLKDAQLVIDATFRLPDLPNRVLP